MLEVLIMSCDSYNDTWLPFSILYNKYFPNNYKTYIVTETKICTYFDTIKKTGAWTKRLREALQELDSEYVLLMLDDYFIHDKVDLERIKETLRLFDDKTATFNFELNYRNAETLRWPYFWKKQYNNQVYLNSTQPSIHNRLKLIERLDKDQTPWEWELTKLDSKYYFFINNGKPIINTGYDINHKPWGIVQGKWSRETKELFDKEGIQVDYEKRGYFN